MTWASTPHTALDDKVQSRIDAHLDAVEKILMRNSATRSERRDIVDGLETQIRDMLAQEVNGGTLKQSDIDAVFNKLDPPSAYANEQGNPAIAAANNLLSQHFWPPNPAWPMGLCAIGWIIVILGIIVPGTANTGLAILLNIVGIVFGVIYRKDSIGRKGLIACIVSTLLLLIVSG